MKGRLSTVLWRSFGLDLAALAAIFYLTYSAGARSGGLSLLDFGALPFEAGLRLWIAGLLAVFLALSLVWQVTRVIKPLNELTTYAEKLETGGDAETSTVTTDDDFAVIADHLATAAHQLSIAAADQRALALLEQRITEFSEVAGQAAAGDVGARAAAGDGALGRALMSFNRALENMGRVLESGGRLAVQLAGTSAESLTLGLGTVKSLGEQEREIAHASESFAVVPPSLKQITDNFEVVLRAAQQAATGAGQAQKGLDGLRGDLERLRGALAAAGEAAHTLQQSAQATGEMLGPLAGVTERANLLALNAALESARTGASGRTSPLLAESFRQLAEESSSTSRQIAAQVAALHEGSAALVRALRQETESVAASLGGASQTAQAVESASAAMQEASARSEVITLACARQSDASRTVTAALQSATDLLRLAQQQARRGTLTSEQLQKLAEELKATLGGLRSGAVQGETAARSSTAAVESAS